LLQVIVRLASSYRQDIEPFLADVLTSFYQLVCCGISIPDEAI
jgi:hypothetical protein